MVEVCDSVIRVNFHGKNNYLFVCSSFPSSFITNVGGMCLKKPSIKASLSWKRCSSWMLASHLGHILLPLHSSHRSKHGALRQMSHNSTLGFWERRMATKIDDREASQFSFRFSILLSHVISSVDWNESRTAWHLAKTSSRDWSVRV